MKLSFKKNPYWYVLNIFILLVYTYFVLGAVFCGKLGIFPDSNNGVLGGWLFGCAVSYGIFLFYFGAILLAVVLLHIIYYAIRKKNFIDKLIIWAIFQASFIVFTYIFGGITSIVSKNSTEKEQTKIETEKQNIEQTENMRDQNSLDNYDLLSCDEELIENGNKSVVNLKCELNVKLTGEYKINAKLAKNNPKETGYDETQLESDNISHLLKSGKNAIDINISYKHKPNTTNGPYYVVINISPGNTLADKLHPHTFTGFVTNTENYTHKPFLVTKAYSGELFKDLSYLPISDN